MHYTYVTSYMHAKQEFSKVISEVFVNGSIFCHVSYTDRVIFSWNLKIAYADARERSGMDLLIYC